MIVLIDCGHGKDTKGKHSPILKQEEVDVWNIYVDNNRFKEWKYTRIIGKDVVNILRSRGIDARLVVEEDNDISLSERVKRANKVCDKEGAKNVIFVSIHSNAVGDGTMWMKGQGWECYTTPGTTKSDKLADCFYERAETNFIGRKIRKDMTDGDPDKEANFYVIKNVKCPAVLTENFFYDNKDDLQYITSNEGHHKVVITHVEAIEEYIAKVEGKDEV